ncbi:hypothetical protein ACJX0J_000400 [Zea mays]
MKVQERILNLFKLVNIVSHLKINLRFRFPVKKKEIIIEKYGQKINPLGFRLGTTQNHHSFWFAQPKNYSEGLQEDKKIRNCIKNYIQKNRKKGSNRKMESDSSSEVITHIEIQKEIDTIHVIIHIGFPNLLKKKELNIAIEKVKEPYRQPNILAEYIAFQLKNRVSYENGYKGNKNPNCGSIRCQKFGYSDRIKKTRTLFFQKSLKKKKKKSFNIIAMLSKEEE